MFTRDSSLSPDFPIKLQVAKTREDRMNNRQLRRGTRTGATSGRPHSFRYTLSIPAKLADTRLKQSERGAIWTQCCLQTWWCWSGCKSRTLRAAAHQASRGSSLVSPTGSSSRRPSVCGPLLSFRGWLWLSSALQSPWSANADSVVSPADCSWSHPASIKTTPLSKSAFHSSSVLG